MFFGHLDSTSDSSTKLTRRVSSVVETVDLNKDKRQASVEEDAVTTRSNSDDEH
jgi:hypothetical protein